MTKRLHWPSFSINLRLLLAILLIMGLSILSLFQSGRWQPTSGPLLLAVAGPMSGANAPNGQAMVRGVQLYLDQVNANGGVHGQRIELLTFDDQGDPDVARQQAQAIVNHDRILAVVGHYSSATTQAASPIYAAAALPALTGSATADAITADNRWYFRTIFSNHDQSIFLANYVQQVMGYTSADIVYDTNLYGTTLATTFEETFTGLGAHIQRKWRLDSTDQQLPEQIEQLVRELTAGRKRANHLLFLATYGAEATELVTKLRRRDFPYPIVGGDALAGVAFANRFHQYPEEQAIPGYFSDGIYATSPILFDLAGEETEHFRQLFLQAYGVEPTWAAATYYDAAQMVVTAIQRADAPADNLIATRTAIRQQLAAINTAAKAVAGVTGKLYFDQQGNSQLAPKIGVFNKGAFISAAVQLQSVPDLTQVTDHEAALAKGDILLVDGNYMVQTDVVYTGIDINEVGNLTNDGGSYTVDFYIWFRARAGVEAANIEFLNYAVGRLDSGQRIQLSEPLATKTENGVTYQAYRLKADFSSDFDFHDYPFDQQRLAIQFRHLSATRDRLIYVVDQAGLGDTSTAGLLAKLEDSGALASLTDWYAAGASFFQDTLHNRSTLGNPQFFAQAADIQYSRFNLVIELRRNVLNFISRNLLPVFFIILLSYLSFFLPQIDFEALIPILTGTVLSIVFFHLDVSNDLGVSYTVALDYVFYILYAMFALQLLLGLVAWRVEAERVKRFTIGIVRLSYPAITLCTIAGFLYVYTDSWPGLGFSGNGDAHALLIAGDANQAQAIGATAPPTAGNGTVQPAVVTLRLGAWRDEDKAAMQQVLAAFQQRYPQIAIQWEASAATNYTAMLMRQFEKGVGPDLFYLPAFSSAAPLWANGYLASLADLPELSKHFTPTDLAPWTMADDLPYGVPLLGVAFGVYYNVDLFKHLGVTPPTTWEALLQSAQTIQQAGYLPFANGIQEGWRVNETIFMNVAPNFIGGRAGRLQYLHGERCFNDAHSVAAFQALAALAPFLPTNKADLDYTDSQQLFLAGKAAMFLGASWDIPTLEAAQAPFAWSVFALPAPQGQPTIVTFQPDTAVGLNAASPHQAEAQRFLAWLATPEATALLQRTIPGVFVPRSTIAPVTNPHAQAFLQLLTDYQSDVGWAWPQISAKLPDAYSLMTTGAVAVIQGEKTPAEAADNLQNGLAQWFQPAQRCLLVK